MTVSSPSQLDGDDTTIVIAGDWHGNTRWAVRAIAACAAEGITTIYNVGDFGLFRDLHHQRYIDSVNSAAEAEKFWSRVACFSQPSP